MSVFFHLSNNVLPCNRVFGRMYLSSLNIGQWRRKYEVDLTTKSQMTQIYSLSYEKSNTFMIIIIKNTPWRGSNKFEDAIFENTNIF